MEKSNHRILLAFIVIIIIGLCGAVGYFMLDKSGMSLSGNSTVSIKQENWNIKITASDNNSNVNLMNIDKNNIKVSGTLNDENDCISYKLNIKNAGTIDAYFYSVVSDNPNIEVELLDGDKKLDSNKILNAKDSIEVVLSIKKNTKDDLDFEANIKLVFNQYNK